MVCFLSEYFLLVNSDSLSVGIAMSVISKTEILGNLKELGKSDLYVLEDIFLDGVEN
jgi:hypothetical protein